MQFLFLVELSNPGLSWKVVCFLWAHILLLAILTQRGGRHKGFCLQFCSTCAAPRPKFCFESPAWVLKSNHIVHSSAFHFIPHQTQHKSQETPSLSSDLDSLQMSFVGNSSNKVIPKHKETKESLLVFQYIFDPGPPQRLWVSNPVMDNP